MSNELQEATSYNVQFGSCCNCSLEILEVIHIASSYPEYCAQVWVLHFQRDAGKLERVQKRVTKIIKGLEQHIYILGNMISLFKY